MIKFNKLFRGYTLILILIGVFIILEFAQSSYALRCPIGSSDIKKRLDETIPEAVRYMYDKRSIIVLDRETGRQVLLKACEISELDDKEREIVAEGLKIWLPQIRFYNTFHAQYIERIIKHLYDTTYNIAHDTPFEDKKIFIYVALTENERDSITNGDKDIVEVMVTVMQHSEDGALVNYMELNPKNRPEIVGIDKVKHIGANRQLLAFAVADMLYKGVQRIQFPSAARDILKKEGIHFLALTKEDLIAFLNGRDEKTLKHLEKDPYAVSILEEIEAISQQSVTDTDI